MARVSSEQEDLLKKQFAAARTRLGAEKRSLGEQLKDKTARQAAILGGGGGAILKSQRKGLEDIARAFGEAETGLEGQEAGALQQAQSEAEARQFAKEERLGAQEFAASEAEKGRALQAEQFGKTLAFQKGSFADTMKFQWAEMDENKKTNFINAWIAMKDAGLVGGGESKNLFSSGLLANIYSPFIKRGPVTYEAEFNNTTVPFYQPQKPDQTRTVSALTRAMQRR